MQKHEIRALVTQGMCPLCPKGPYKVVSVHTNKVHGVDKVALRQMAGMTTNEPTCSPEFSARAAEVGKALNADKMRDLAAQAKGKTWEERGGRSYTEAGRERNTRSLQEWNSTPDAAAQRAAAARASKQPEAIQKWRASMDSRSKRK